MRWFLFLGLFAGCQVLSGEADREFTGPSVGGAGGEAACAAPVACGSCAEDACCEESCGQECSCRNGCACRYDCPSPPCALHCESNGGCLLFCHDATPQSPACRMEECNNAVICDDGSTIACNTPCPPSG